MAVLSIHREFALTFFSCDEPPDSRTLSCLLGAERSCYSYAVGCSPTIETLQRLHTAVLNVVYIAKVPDLWTTFSSLHDSAP